MNRNLLTELAWLPPAPADFAASCRALEEPDEALLGSRLQVFAGRALDENQLNRLARFIVRATAEGRSLAPLVPFRLGLVSNATTQPLVPALIATAARHGIALTCIEADYGQVVQEALSPNSAIGRARPDAVLVALDFRGLPIRVTPGDAPAAEATVAACLHQLAAIRDGLHANGVGVCVVQTLARPPEALFGSLDLALPGTIRNVVDAINRGIAASITGTADLLFDVAGLAETVGLADWHDPTLWNMAKLPFASAFLPLYAEHLCRILAALRGRSRRCLILDLDNTVWSGVIGDDGLEGIVIGQGDPTGEAHLAVQHTALMLRDRGIVLAVSSKNHDEIARLPFRKHQEMLLREDHIAVFQANWNDKASNIVAIANELSLGLDAMVFLDDNPAERGLVRRLLPSVAVPELPADPALYARTLLAAGYFEATVFSAEDRARSEFYQDNARRIALQKQSGDVDAYLASLDMVITFQPFDETGRARIAQLINKSNQFNLTTRRYSDADVAAAEHDPACFTLQVRLADTFGDNGMICVVICKPVGDDWEIDTWLMSCRVLGRRVEQAVLAEILTAARARNIRRLVGVYRPTPRNRLVEEHYRKLGFTPAGGEADGTTRWTLEVAAAPVAPVPMIVRRLGGHERAIANADALTESVAGR
jgi:FkbH-like protein